MKVDGIEVLRMARDGELKPKTILKTYHTDSSTYYSNYEYDYYIYYGNNQFQRCNEDGKVGSKYQNRFLNYKVLQKEFEIIEPKEIDEEIEKLGQLTPYTETYDAVRRIHDKINELIDEVNKLKKGE